MISTKYLLRSGKDVPEVWIFEFYCKLSEHLTGQDIKIKSLFNPSEKTPSMCLFAKDGKYYFKDFSTGKGGSAIKFVQELFNEDFYKSSMRVVEDYNRFILMNNGTQHKLSEFKVHSRYKVTSTTVRPWIIQDKNYWQDYGISSKLLDKYNVKPLESYKMDKEEDGEEKSLEIKGLFIYGYFKQDGTLYKVYQPKVKEHKFIKVGSYLQGSEQLENHPYLIICSSLKDLLVVKSMGLSIDVIAPDSENTTIKKETIEHYQSQYKKVVTMFDNDEAGINAMKKYKEVYNLDYVYFDLEKDVADAVKMHGQSKTFLKLLPAINKKLNEQEKSSST